MVLWGALVSWLNKLVIMVFIFSFITSGLVLNVLQIALLPLYWIHRYTYRILNARIVYFHWALIPWALESWAGYKIRLFSKEKDLQYTNTEHALCVLNHHGDLDWMIGWCVIERMGMLGGAKAIMKDVAKYIPGIGWMFLFMEYPILKRRWEDDKSRLAASCRVLSDYPVNMLLCLFAEGTRFTEAKHKISMQVADEKGLKRLKHHLLPRKKGFVFLAQHLKVPALYDVTITYLEGKPSVLGVINRVSCACDVLVRRIPMTEVPTHSAEETEKFLYKLFEEKDDFVDYHLHHKTFPKSYKASPLPPRPWPRRVFYLWVTLFALPLVSFTVYLIWVKAWYTLSGLVSIVITIHQLFFIIVKLTEVKHSSSLGLTRVLPEQNGTLKKD